MSLTTDQTDPGLRTIQPNGQQQAYLVLSDEERAKGFVRPVRHAYRHLACGSVTTMGAALSETYARNPKFYGGTFCCKCGSHFPLQSLVVERNELDAANEALRLLLSKEPVDGPAFAAAQKRCRDAEAAWRAADVSGGWQFEWTADGEPVRSTAEEAAEYLAARQLREIPAMKAERDRRIAAARAELDAALTSPEWVACTCCECSAEYPCDYQDKEHDSVFCPRCRKAEASKVTAKAILGEIEQEGQPPRPGLRCPKCGDQLVHNRLTGYRCIRGCQ